MSILEEIHYLNVHKQSVLSSPIVPAFMNESAEPINYLAVGALDSYVFNPDNWADSIFDKLREFIEDFYYGHNPKKGQLTVHIEWVEGQWHVFITNRNTNQVYHISWYKGRGRTEVFDNLTVRTPATLQDLLEIYEELVY